MTMAPAFERATSAEPAAEIDEEDPPAEEAEEAAVAEDVLFAADEVDAAAAPASEDLESARDALAALPERDDMAELPPLDAELSPFMRADKYARTVSVAWASDPTNPGSALLIVSNIGAHEIEPTLVMGARTATIHLPISCQNTLASSEVTAG